MVNSKNVRCLLLLIGNWLIDTTAFALPRFHHSEANQVTHDRIDVEHFTDLWGYRFGDLWDQLWLQSEVGYRVNAGSLDNRHFHFTEELKLASDPYGKVDIGFRSERRSDQAEEQQLSEVRLAIAMQAPWYLSILGYTGGQKKYSDYGFAIEHRRSADERAELYYIDTLGLYSQKGRTADRMVKQPYEVGFRFRQSIFANWHLSARFSYHHPMRWWRPTQDYIYDYGRRSGWLALSHTLLDGKRVTMRWSYDRKREAKEWLGELYDLPDEGYLKSVDRSVGSIDVRLADLTRDPVYWTVGLVIHGLDAVYNPPNLDDEWFNKVPERPQLDLWQRDIHLYGSYQWAVGTAQRHRWRVSMLAGHVHRQLGPDRVTSIEAKPDIAWELKVNERSHFLLRATFDLDEVFKYYPYKNQRPSWDGGQGQLMITF